MPNKNKQSNVAVARVGTTKQSVIDAVDKAMELAKCRAFLKPLKGRTKVFLKVNLLSHQVVPGHCTSPYVLEGVISKLRQMGNFDIYVGDADVATIKQVELAARNWGVIDICRKYGAKFVNLSKQPVKEVDFNGEIFKKIYVPQILADVDYIITMPVPKTHNVSTMTCALKNQWGCLPRFRQ